LELSILQPGRNEEKFARGKIDIGASKFSRHTTDDGELTTWRRFARRIKIPFLNLKEFVTDERFAFWPNEFGCDILEIDRSHRLLDVELAGLTGIIAPVPIEDTIRRVAVLLDFDEKIACAHCVKTSGRKKCGVTWFDTNFVNVISSCSLTQRVFELNARTGFAKTK